MPNHVSHKLTISADDPTKVLDHVRSDESAFDFDRIVPMPVQLDIESSADGRIGAAVLAHDCDNYLSRQWVKDLGISTPEQFLAYLQTERPQVLQLGAKYLENRENFGHFTWYEWRQSHWGTKWNAYYVAEPELGDRDAVVRFDTAWTLPVPLLTRLSEQFPSADFTLKYFEENWGFAGTDHFRAGERTVHSFVPSVGDPITQETYQAVYCVELELGLTPDRRAIGQANTQSD